MSSIRFPTEEEAIEYAKSNGISLDQICFSNDWLIKTSPAEAFLSSKTHNRKTSIASKLGNYTGVGYVIHTDWKESYYDTGIKSHPKSPMVFDALVYFDEKDAKRAARFSVANKTVEKVWIENGRIKRFMIPNP